MAIDLSVFDSFPVLRTPRLELREIQMEDARRIYDMRSNQRVNQFIARPQMQGLEAAEELTAKTIKAFQDKQGIGWAGILREGADIIGTCGFNRVDLLNHRLEIGGEMATEYWGKGIALEAVQAILDFGLNRLGAHAIEARIYPTNRGAAHILERLGFVKEAHFRDRIWFQNRYQDLAVYTLFLDNWKG